MLVEAKQASELVRVAARRASVDLPPDGSETEVVWVDGDSELAVSLVKLRVKLADGLISGAYPRALRPDRISLVEVDFAIGSADAPAGLRLDL